MKRATPTMAALAVLLAITAVPAMAQPRSAPTRDLPMGFGRPHVVFTPNRGQVADVAGQLRPDVLYSAAAGDVRLYLRTGGISYVFPRYEANDGQHGHAHEVDEAATLCRRQQHLVELYRMDVELVGANPRARVVEADRVPGVEHFYLPHCPDGVVRVPSFQQVTVADVWPGIDMILRGLDGGVKCDFVVRPGGRISDIRLRYVGAESVSVTRDGELVATTPLGEHREDAPVVFVDDADRTPLAGRFVVTGEEVTFDVEGAPEGRTVIVDPVQRWATYYGGANNESLGGGDPTEVDRGGNALVTGTVDANTFPATTGAFQTTYGGSGDAFVLKFDGDGVRQWATYYGGSGDDLAHGLVCDTSLNVFVAGHTQSSNFPTSAGAFQASFGSGTRDAFVVKLDEDGVRSWGTYYGGSNWDDGYGFAADSAGNVALLVTTGTSGLQTSGMATKPAAAGNYDLLIAKFSAAGARTWATYIGGGGTDFGYAAGTDTSEAIIIAGWTSSTNFPTQNAAQATFGGGTDLVVAKFDRDGVRQWSTYYGGGGTECDETSPTGRAQGYCGLATDRAGNVFVTGLTTGSFPTTTGALQTTFGGGGRDAFLLKLSATGARQWATYFGGGGDDVGTGVAARPDGAALMTGWTASTNLRTSADCNVCRNQGARDVMIVRLDSVGALDFSDYYGGTSNDEGHGISFDPYGSMVVAGMTFSTNFPTLNAHQSTKGGTGTTTSDAFVMLFCDPAPPLVDSSGSLNICTGDSVVLTGMDGYESYRWNDGSGTTSRRLVVRQTGNYVLWARGYNGCEATSDTFKVRVNQPLRASITPGPTIRLCAGDSVVLDAGSDFAGYSWLPTGQTVRRIVVRQSGSFRVATIDRNGCRDTSTVVTVTVYPRPDTAIISPAGPVVICEGDPLTLSSSGSPVDTYTWSDGATGQSRPVTASGRYNVLVRNAAGCTMRSTDVVVTVNPRPRPVITSSNGSVLCKGDSLRLYVQPGFVSYRWSTGDSTEGIWVRGSGDYSITVRDTNGCEGTANFPVTVIEMEKPTIQIRGGNTICEGDTVVLEAIGFFQRIVWSNGAITPTMRTTEAGEYWATVVGPYNCTAISDTVRIAVRPRPRADLTGPEVICANTRASYSVTRSDSVTYEWTVAGGGGTIVSGAGTSGIEVQWGASGSGTVRVTVTDPRTGCTTSVDLRVTIGTTLVPAVTPSGSVTLCAGESITLDAGAGYANYRWSTGETTRTIVVRTGGTYTVTVANAQGCGGTSAPVRVSVRPLPTPVLTPSGTRTLCPGEALTLSTGAFLRYEWSNGARTATTVVTQPGTYYVTVYDSAGCRGRSDTLRVRLGSVVAPEIVGARSVCRSSTAQYCVPADAGTEFTWTVVGGTIRSGQGTSCVTVDWGSGTAGRVELTLRVAPDGCRASTNAASVVIATSLSPVISSSGPPAVCAGGTLTIEAPDGYARYQWSTGEQSRTIRVGPGRYVVEVFDAGGCSGKDSIDVAERPLPRPVIEGGPAELCEGDSVTLSAPAGFVSYEWTDSTTGATVGATSAFVASRSGTYAVTVVDAFGCVGTSPLVRITVHPTPAEPVITRRGTLLESTPAFRYQWLFEGEDVPGATERTYEPRRVGEHRVRITDSNGCSALSQPVAGAAAAAIVALPVIEASPGDRVTIPVTLVASNNLDDVGATRFTATIRFNRTLLFPTGATPIGVIDGRDRVITFEGVRRSGEVDGVTATLEFVAALGDTTHTPLTFERFDFGQTVGEVRTSVQSGLLRIVPRGGWNLYVSGDDLSISQIGQNPATHSTTIEFGTIEPGRTTVEMFDIVGRSVAVLFDADVDPGQRSIVIETDRYAAGTYFVVLTTPTGSDVAPIQIAD